MSQMTVDRAKEISVLHNEWSRHPMTKELLEMVKKQQKSITDKMAMRSMDEAVPDNQFRNLATQLRTLIMVEALITNADTFTNNIK